MTEFTTGVVFLMSSLYGAGHANANLASAATAIQNDRPASTTKTAENTSLTDYIDIESYVRSQYADAPILVDIARCESHLHQFNTDGTVVRGISNKLDVGIMQINEKYHGDEAARLGYDIYTIKGNVAYGWYLYTKYGTEPWHFSAKCWAQGDLARK